MLGKFNMNDAIKNTTGIIAVVCMILFSGCSLNSLLFKESCGIEFTLQEKREVSSAHKYKNPAEKVIFLGMSKKQVLEAWGKADTYVDFEKQEWIYSERKLNDTQHVRYWIFFKDDRLVKIEELLMQKEYKCRTIDL